MCYKTLKVSLFQQTLLLKVRLFAKEFRQKAKGKYFLSKS